MANVAQFMPQLAVLAKHGVEVTLVSETKVTVGGFYKSNQVYVDFEQMTIRDRYNETSQFDETDFLDELVLVNEAWHDYSKDRFEGWKEMAPEWVAVAKEVRAG